MSDLELSTNLIQRINIGDSLTRSAWRMPNRIALVDGDRRLTYRQFNRWVNRFAHALCSRGFSHGDSIALVLGNSAEFLVTYYACAKIGAVCVPVNLG